MGHWQALDAMKAMMIKLHTMPPFMLHLLLHLVCALQNGATPLHLAAERGMAEAVHLLIRHGAEVNAQRSNGQTALFEAAFSGCIDAAKALLQHGADPGGQSCAKRFCQCLLLS